MPYSKQCKRDQILLSLISKRSDIKDPSNFKQFFEVLINSLNQINSDPINLSNGWIVKVNLQAVVADNLASNELQSICRCFRWDACKYCLIYQDDIRNDFIQRYNNLESDDLEAENERLADLIRDLTEDQIFSRVDFSGPLYAPDVFHDINEGIVPLIINWLLRKASPSARKLIQQRCRRETPEAAVYNIEKFNIKGTGVQKLLFFYYFPIFFNSISKTSNEWKLYLALRVIINFSLSPSLYEQDIDLFNRKCIEFCYYFTFFFGRATFKVHHLIHYANAIRNFGPLFYYSTLRYERVHQFLKRLVRSSKNFITLPKQIAYMWTALNCISIKETSPEAEEDIYELYEPVDFNDYVPEHLLTFINSQQSFKLLNSFNINDIIIEPNQIFLYEYKISTDNPLPQFIKIIYLLKQGDSEVKVIGHKLNSTRYLNGLDCFNVVENTYVEEINVFNFKYHQSLKIFSTNLGNLIPNTFYIPFEIFYIYAPQIELVNPVAELSNIDELLERDDD